MIGSVREEQPARGQPAIGGMPTEKAFGSGRALAWTLVLLVVALKVLVALRGGQGFLPVETNYSVSREAWTSLAGGAKAAAMHRIFEYGDSAGFRLLGMMPAGLERLMGGAESAGVLAALFFGGFGVGTMALGWRLLRRQGASERGAWGGVLGYAGCASGLYLARHWQPYDASLFFIVLGCWLGAEKPGRAVAAGAGIAFGAWLCPAYGAVAVVAALALTAGSRDAHMRAGRRALWMAMGITVVVLAAVVAVRAVGGRWSPGAAHGDGGWFDVVTGWAGYAWGVEGLFLVAMLGAAIIAGGAGAAVGRLWVLGAAGTAVLMALAAGLGSGSAAIGSAIRPVIFMAAVGGGCCLGEAAASRTERIRWMIGGAVGLVCFANWRAPITQVFPDEFVEQTSELARAARVRDSRAVVQWWNVADQATAPERLPPYEVLSSAPHPLAYAGYHYALGGTSVKGPFEMELVRVIDADARWRFGQAADSAIFLTPGTEAIELQVKLPRPLTEVGVASPLLSVGALEDAHVWAIRPVSADTFQLELYRSGRSVAKSATLRVSSDPNHRYVAVTRLALARTDADTAGLGRVVAEWDGERVIPEAVSGRQPRAESLTVGRNFTGLRGVRPTLNGEITAVREVQSGMVARRELNLETPKSGEYAAPGPLSIRFEWDARKRAGGQTLIAVARERSRAKVTLEPVSGGTVAKLWVDGQWQGTSTVLPWTDGVHTAEVAMPPLLNLPHATAAGDLVATWMAYHYWLKLDGRVLFDVGPISSGVPLDTAGNFLPCTTLVDFGTDWPIGGGYARDFDGRILEVVPADPHREALLGWTMPSLAAGGEKSVETLKMTLQFKPELVGRAQPLVTTGVTGAGDFFYVVYVDSGHIRLGHDHWGTQPWVSAPLACDFGRTHELRLSPVSLGGTNPASGYADRRVKLDFDGQTVVDAPQSVYGYAANAVEVGWNLIGGSACEMRFTGEIVAVSRE